MIYIGGEATSWSLSTDLPAGLTFDDTNGNRNIYIYIYIYIEL